MTVREAIEQNPKKSNKEIAEITGTTPGYVKTERHRIKKRKPRHPALAEQCAAVGLPLDNVSHYWHKGKHFSIFVKGDKPVSYEDVRAELVAEMKAYAPVYQKIEYAKDLGGYLLMIDPADIHLGKICRAIETGEEYNSQIAERMVNEGVRGILARVSGFFIAKILFVVGNDVLHVDTPSNTTTSGTRQDVCDMWYENYKVGKRLYVDIIELLRTVAPVHVQYDPSNHDYTNGFFLADTLVSWFHNCPDVTFDASPAHRKYFTYGRNLIGTTHGDGAKGKDLGALMAHEASEHWHPCDRRYFYTHHIHSKKAEDQFSVAVESLRSPSGADSWHHRNGYQHAPRAVEGYLHHPEHGQIARITHLF